MGANRVQWTRLSTVLDDSSADRVATQRAMMVFRARMQTVESRVADIGGHLAEFDATSAAIRAQALQALETSRQTVALCDRLLELIGEDGEEG